MRFNFRTTTLTVAILSFFLFCFGCEKDVGAGPVAPDFSLPDLNGRMKTLSQHRGQVVLLDFWATWCPPCRMSIPFLIKMQKKYAEKGFIVLGISADDPRRATDTSLKDFKKKYKINYPVMRYKQKVLNDYFFYGSMSLPTMFIIDREGRIRDKIIGFDPDHIARALEKLLG
ncbi:MAG: TlpA family protein disulfide reductase [Desulfobacterales bacterium]|nr:TlpA family protein disulfide reductase [Desulfobacterales bacterium]